MWTSPTRYRTKDSFLAPRIRSTWSSRSSSPPPLPHYVASSHPLPPPQLFPLAPPCKSSVCSLEPGNTGYQPGNSPDKLVATLPPPPHAQVSRFNTRNNKKMNQKPNSSCECLTHAIGIRVTLFGAGRARPYACDPSLYFCHPLAPNVPGNVPTYLPMPRYPSVLMTYCLEVWRGRGDGPFLVHPGSVSHRFTRTRTRGKKYLLIVERMPLKCLGVMYTNSSGSSSHLLRVKKKIDT